MPRNRSFNPKRSFRGNRYINPMNSESDSMPKILSSASKRKLSYLEESKSTLPRPSENQDTDVSTNDSFGDRNIIISLDLLNKLLNKCVKCKFCDSEFSVCVSESEMARKGLATKIELKCNNCSVYKSSMTSKLNKNRFYEINTRLVLGMRCIGKGRKAAETLCAVMNLPPPPKFQTQVKAILASINLVAEVSMKKAACETSELTGSNDIVGAFDGTWQRRGHSSLNGVVSVTSFETGKVLDVEVMSKHCRSCLLHADKDHKCSKNYEGYSGGMEVEGALRIYKRSEEKLNIRYVGYLGDGDSKAFNKVQEEKPYGPDVDIKKMECVGHVQKRMGTRLRSLVKSAKNDKTGKKIRLGGAGRLTSAEIDRLQQYYGLAIRRNVGNLVAMRNAVWAIYFHKISTDEDESHGLCPPGTDSWCKFQKAKAVGKKSEYRHQHSIPVEVMVAVKQVFRDLSDKRLLEKCMHGKTQNPNESFNNVIWDRVPKNVFVQLDTLMFGVLDALITFNDGSISRTNILKNMSIEPGYNMTRGLRAIDALHVLEADRATEKLTKEARTRRRLQKKKRDDKEEQEQTEYGAGMF